MKVLSIDPGKMGGIAYLNLNSETNILELLTITETPIDNKTKDYQICDIWKLLVKCKPDLVLLEEIQARGACGTLNVQQMGRGEGMWLTMLAILHIPYVRINPQSWTRKLGLVYKPDKTLSNAANQKLLKLTHIDRAIQLYPTFKDQFYTEKGRAKDGPADAVIIAAYWHKYINEVSNVN